MADEKIEPTWDNGIPSCIVQCDSWIPGHDGYPGNCAIDGMCNEICEPAVRQMGEWIGVLEGSLSRMIAATRDVFPGINGSCYVDTPTQVCAANRLRDECDDAARKMGA